MNMRFLHLPEDVTPRTRNAIRYAGIITLATIIVLPVELYLAFRTGAWQLWAATIIIIGVFASSLISRQLIRKGNIQRGVQVLISSILLGLVANPFLITDLGVAFGITAVILTVLIASQTVERPERFVIASFVAGAIAILADLFLPPYRLIVPVLQVFAPVIITVVIVILGFMTLRRFRDFSLRTKLIIVIVAIVVVSVGVIAFWTNRSLSSDLTRNIGSNLSTLANSKAIEIAQTVDHEADLLRALSLSKTIQNLAANASQGKFLSQAEIEQLDRQWRDADANNDNANPLVASVLHNNSASELLQFQQEFSQHVEIFLTNQQGVNLAATNRTSDYYQADEEWWQIAYSKGLFIGQPAYDESSKTIAIIMAVAVREPESGNVVGILRTTVNFNSLTHSLVAGLFGKTGQTEVYLPDGQELALETRADGTFSTILEEARLDTNVLNQSTETYFEISQGQTPTLASQASVAVLGDTDEDTLAISDLNWRVVVFQSKAEALQPIRLQTRNIVFLAFIISIAATFAALGLAQVISGPIVRLNAIAEQVAAGDLSVQAIVETSDETGTLAKTFNSMTTQLRSLIGTLEQSVADRTKALATSAEVSRHLSTILNERQLIIEVVEQIKAAFDYYHVHVYLLDETSGDLIMAGGTGDVGASMLGSGHKISKGKGLVGRAAGTNAPILVSDTSQDPDWLPNPLLPETNSEAAVPIAAGDKVVGVLDVQHNKTNGLQQADVDLLQSLANQVAIALQNARSYADMQQRAEREARVISIGQKIQSTTSVEGALQTVVRELGRTLGTNDIRVILEAPGLTGSRQKPDQLASSTEELHLS